MSDTTATTDKEVLIETISDQLAALAVLDEYNVREFRKQYPQYLFTVCFEDDLGEREPFLVRDSFDLHLMVSGNGSCSHLTFDVESCSGLVIALHEE